MLATLSKPPIVALTDGPDKDVIDVTEEYQEIIYLVRNHGRDLLSETAIVLLLALLSEANQLLKIVTPDQVGYNELQENSEIEYSRVSFRDGSWGSIPGARPISDIIRE